MNVSSSVALQLKPDDLGTLKVRLLPVAGCWVAIADQLGMTPQVTNIRASPGNVTPADFLRDLLNRWLYREHPSPSLDSLCEGLRGDTSIVGGDRVAHSLEETFQGQRGMLADILCTREKFLIVVLAGCVNRILPVIWHKLW